MEKRFTMSKKEKELMEIFWDSDDALARSEILERAERRQCSWKPNSIHILLNSLIKKGAVKVSGFYLSSRKLGRTFEAAVSREDYALMQIELAADQAKAEGVSDAEKLMSALINDKATAAELDEMARLIETKKQEIKARKKKS